MEEIIVKNENVAEEAAQAKWKFRKLKGDDIFLMTPIIRKIGISNFRRCFDGDVIRGVNALTKGKEYKEQIDMAVATAMLECGQVLIEGLDVCRNEIYNLLSKTSNLSFDQVKNLELVELPLMIIDFVKKDEFKDFLQVAQRFAK